MPRGAKLERIRSELAMTKKIKGEDLEREEGEEEEKP